MIAGRHPGGEKGHIEGWGGGKHSLESDRIFFEKQCHGFLCAYKS